MELYRVIANYAEENGIEKFQAQDINNDTVKEWAFEYAVNYSGTFSFMVDMQRQAQTGRISEGQAKGILNCALAENRFNPEPINVDFSAPTSSEVVVPNGTYTVVFPDQDYRTIKISDDFRDGEDGQMASFLSGPDNTRDFTGFAFISGDRVSVWKRFKQDTVIVNALNLLFEDEENWREAGHAYAVESGRCFRCGRTLTVPDSIYAGLGPECQKKLMG